MTRLRTAAVLVAASLTTSLLVSLAPASAAPTPVQPIGAWCANAPGPGFFDSGTSVHLPAIVCVTTGGIARGTSATTFDPGEPVTRGQMASFIARAMELAHALATGEMAALPSAPADHFVDDQGSTHEANINRLAAAGVVNGVGGGRFDPSAPVSRAQMATFIASANRYLGAVPPFSTDVDHFSDDDGNRHEPAINAVAGAGIAQGTSATAYSPSEPVRRASMATFIARFLAVLHDRGAVTALPAPEVGNGQIAYVGSSEDGTETPTLFLVDPDGRNRRPLPSSPGGSTGYQWSPDWSPDGLQLLYNELGVQVAEMVATDSNGSRWRTLGGGRRQLAYSWSPDGGSFAHRTEVQDESGQWADRLAISDLRSDEDRILGPYTGAEWAPDGSRILTRRGLQWVIIGLDGAVQRTVNLEYAFSSALPSWSPDGTTFVYECPTDDTDHAICTVPADGGETPTRLSPPGAPPEHLPTWSPDGTTIAFVQQDPGDPDTASLWLMDADGSDRRQVPGARPIVVQGSSSLSWQPVLRP